METTSLYRIFRQNVTSVCYITQETGDRGWYIRLEVWIGMLEYCLSLKFATI